MKTASRSCFWLPEIHTLDETIEERCWVGVTFRLRMSFFKIFDLDADIADISIENAKFWPIFANLGYFVVNLRTFWYTLL